jgi:tRNA(Ile)-lysidine synthetase-like protein
LTETLGRTAEILQAEEEFLNAMAIKALADVQEVNNNLSGAEKPCLKLKEFLALEPVLARRVVRLWICLELDYGSVLRVMDLAHKGKVGNVAELVGPWIVKRGYKEIYVLPKEEPQVLSQSLPGQPDPKQPDCKQPAPETRPMPEDAWVEVGGELLAMARICSWAEGKTISEEISLSEGVLRYVIPWQRSLGLPIWRSRKSGDWIQFAYGRKKLSRWLIDQKIPAPKRDLLYCLAWQQQILWVPDLLKGQGPIRKSQAEEYLWVWCKKQNKKNM